MEAPTSPLEETPQVVFVPAACCGVVGLKTNFRFYFDKGDSRSQAHLDTVGPIGKDVHHVVQGLDLLQNGFAARYQRAVAAKLYREEDYRDPEQNPATTVPTKRAKRTKSFAEGQFKVTTLDQGFKAKWDQAKKDGNN